MHCVLANKSIIQISGEDRHKFLQGQITADLSASSAGESCLSCLCSAKGKTWAILHIFVEAERFLLVTDSGCTYNTLRELNKYAVFSKVEIEDVSAHYALLGIISADLPSSIATSLVPAAESSATIPSSHWQSAQFQQGDFSSWITAFTLPENRFLVLTDKRSPLSAAVTALPEMPLSQWEAMHIQAGIPQLAAEQSEEYVPQMMNLQALDAISFSKGCYMGQEVVARTKYLGKNKRAGQVLNSVSELNIQPGDNLELQLGENWRRIGKCLYSATNKQQTWVFAVLPNDLEPDAVIRLQGNENSRLTLNALPYELN